ncbi:MAG: RHS repeat-associated core domain-containing protein [bacterium]
MPEESHWYRGSDAYQQTHLDNRLGFAGYVWDPWLKVYHVRHRVYDPFDTRWLQADPIGYAGGDTDLRRYCNGDPVNYVDPMGLAGGAAGMTDEYWNNRHERRQNGPTSPASPLPPNAAGGFINGAGEQAYQLVWGSWMAKGEAIGNAAVGAWERAETTAGGIAGAAGAGAVELVHQTVVIPREVKDGIKTSLENVVSAVTGTDVSTGETLTAYERGERLGAFFIDALTAKIAADGAGRPTRGTAPGQPASGAEKGGSCGGGGGNSGAKPGSYRPDEPLPRNPGGTPKPSSDQPHTQIGTRTGRSGDYTQAREFGENGRVIRDIDFTDHGRPDVPGHTNPHQHPYNPNPTGGTPSRGPAEPFVPPTGPFL